MKGLSKIEVERATAMSMTSDLLQDLVAAFQKRKDRMISAAELVSEIEDRILAYSDYDLPIISEHLDTYQDNRLCRLIYQYMVARSYRSRTQIGVSVKVLSQICGASILETYAAVHRIELSGAIMQEYVINGERKKVETDRFMLSQDISFLWESYLTWGNFPNKDKGNIAEHLDFMIYQNWRRRNVQPS